MTTGDIIRLVLQTLVFIAWAFMAYRLFSTLRARNEDQAGGVMGHLKHWWQNPDDRPDRNTLVWLTLVLLAMFATNTLL